MSITLRPYQTDARYQLNALLNASRHPVFVSPTGTGKTKASTAVIADRVSIGRRVFVLVPSVEIFSQWITDLSDAGLNPGYINDQHFKRLVYSYIEREADYKRGYIHFPSDLGEDYFKGLTAEDMIETTTPTGKTVYKIMNNKKRRNEPLDLQKMAYAALYFMTGEYYKAINKRRVASKKTEIPPDLDEFIRVMTPDSDFADEGEE